MLTHPQIHTQSGNILLYILGAIVLIGLLVTMVKGSTTPGAGIDREALEIRVAEVQAYGNELERAVAYILRNGYSETDIRFAHPNHDSAYGDITDDPGRQVFAREGGGATWRDNETDIQTVDTDWFFTISNQVEEIGTTGPLNVHSHSELLAILPDVKRDFCITLNNKVGVLNPSNSPPRDLNSMFIDSREFDGTLTTANLRITDGPPNYVLNGKMEACFEGGDTPPTGTYHYYRVLLAR